MGLWVRGTRTGLGWLGPRRGLCRYRRSRPSRRRAPPWRRPQRRSSSRATAASKRTIRSYFAPAPASGSDTQDRRRRQGAVRDRPVPGRAHHLCRRPSRSSRWSRTRSSAASVRGQQARQGRAAQAEIQSKPRGALSRPTVQADVQRIVEIYRRTGRYDVARRAEDHRAAEQPRRPRVRDQRGRARPRVKEINFVGNRAYSTWRLRDVIKTGADAISSASSRPPTSTIPTASRPTASCCAASI